MVQITSLKKRPLSGCSILKFVNLLILNDVSITVTANKGEFHINYQWGLMFT